MRATRSRRWAAAWRSSKTAGESTALLTLQSGQPFTLNYNYEDDYSGGGDGFDRPDVVGPVVYNKNNPSNFLQLSSFAMPCMSSGITNSTLSGFASDCVPGTRHYGNLGRNALSGPTFKQWDIAIYKDTPLTERLTMQLRADFFNILNHPNFSNPVLPAFIADPASNLISPLRPGGGCGCGFVLPNGPPRKSATALTRSLPPVT